MTIRNTVAAHRTAIDGAIARDASPVQDGDITTWDPIRTILLDIVESFLDRATMQGVALPVADATGALLKARLEALAGANRLQASAVQGIPPAYVLTSDGLWDALGPLTGAGFERTRLGSTSLSGNANIWHDTGMSIPATGWGRVVFTVGVLRYYRIVDYSVLRGLTANSIAGAVNTAVGAYRITLGSKVAYLGRTSGNNLLYGSETRVTESVTVDTLGVGTGASPPPAVSTHQRYGAYGADATFTRADLTGGVSDTTGTLTLSGATGRQYVAFWSAEQLTTIIPVGRLSGLGLSNLLPRFTESRLTIPSGGTNGYLYVSTTDFPAEAINGAWTLT